MSKRTIIRRVFAYIRRQRLQVVLSFFLAAVYVALTLLVPILVGRAVDELAAGNFRSIFPYLFVLLGSALVAAGAQWTMSHLHNRIAARILRDIRADAFEKLFRLPFSMLDRTPTGDTVSRVMTDAETLVDGLLMGFTQLFTGVLTVIGTIVFMLMMNWQITLVVAILTPLSIFFARFIARGTYRHFSAILKELSTRV